MLYEVITIRNRLSLKAGISNDTARVYPEIIREFQIFNYLGQAHLLSGSDSATNGAELEAGLDLTPLLSEIRTGQPFKVFLIADQRDLSDGQAKGIIHSFSVFSDGVEYVITSYSIHYTKLYDVGKLSVLHC